MNKIINRIREIIGTEQKLSITIWNDEIWFDIYETEIPIVYKSKKDEIFMNCETCNLHLDSSMLYELYMITEFLESSEAKKVLCELTRKD